MFAIDTVALIEWPAMLTTVLATWLVASQRPARRRLSFWLFLLGNLLWLVWAVHTSAAALAALQFCLAALNIRATRKTRDA